MRNPWLRMKLESSGSLWNWMVTSDPPETIWKRSLDLRYCPIAWDIRSCPSKMVSTSVWRMFKLSEGQTRIGRWDKVSLQRDSFFFFLDEQSTHMMQRKGRRLYKAATWFFIPLYLLLTILILMRYNLRTTKRVQ